MKETYLKDMAETIERRFATYQKTVEFLDLVPEEIVSYASIGDITLLPATYEENMETLHSLRQSMELTLDRYWLSGNQLGLSYKINGTNIDLDMYCTDLDYALLKVGQGKCSIVETPSHYVSKTIVCGM